MMQTGLRDIQIQHFKEDTNAKFTNTREGTIPTGVILSIAAPAAVGAAAIGGIAFILIRNKRRKSEEE